MCLYLDARNALIKQETLSIGLLDKNLIHPREVFSEALKNNAASIILIHNHPSGNPNPSIKDKEIVTKISQAGNIMGIPVLDFIIIAKDGHYSFYKQLKNNNSADYVAECLQMGLFDLLEVEKPVYNKTNIHKVDPKHYLYCNLFAGIRLVFI